MLLSSLRIFYFSAASGLWRLKEKKFTRNFIARARRFFFLSFEQAITAGCKISSRQSYYIIGTCKKLCKKQKKIEFELFSFYFNDKSHGYFSLYKPSETTQERKMSTVISKHNMRYKSYYILSWNQYVYNGIVFGLTDFLFFFFLLFIHSYSYWKCIKKKKNNRYFPVVFFGISNVKTR